jgi:hypothetical protein
VLIGNFSFHRTGKLGIIAFQKEKTMRSAMLSKLSSFDIMEIVCLIVVSLPVPASAQEKAAPPPEPAQVQAGLDVSGQPGVDITCQSDVLYTWRRVIKNEQNDQKNQAAPPPPQEEPAPSEVFYVTLGENGLIENDVRTRLTSRLAAIKAQALTYCKNMHEDRSGCIISRLKSQPKDYAVMDFSARKTLLAAIEGDCANDTGICLSSESKEIRCFVNKPPDMGVSKTEGTEAKKDDKDKKKK